MAYSNFFNQSAQLHKLTTVFILHIFDLPEYINGISKREDFSQNAKNCAGLFEFFPLQNHRFNCCGTDSAFITNNFSLALLNKVT